MKRLICTALFTLAASAPAWSQGKLDADTMKHFGGTYMVDCGNNASAKATVFADALVFLQGDKRVAGAKPQPSGSFYDPNTPPEFRVMLMSDAQGGQLLFAIYQDRAGYYLKLDGDAKVIAAVGRALAQQKFRRCDGGASKPSQTAAAVSPQKKYELHELDANLVLLSPKVKATYFKALGPLAREHWLAKLDGPAPQNKRIRVAGADFVQLSSCKNHDCADNNALFLYSVEQGALYGTIYQKGRTTLIGAPPPAVVSALPALWKKEWRQ
ncbi:MAG: Ivy family c-type lysozyme inhibitor [Burkholderiaceae bacterium]